MSIIKSVQSTLRRDSFGAIYTDQNTNDNDRSLIKGAMELVQKAEISKKISKKVDDMVWGSSGKERGKMIGSAVRHEIYDVTPDGRAVLMCCRGVEGDRYGQKTTFKDYYLIRAHGAGTRVTVAKKSIAAKTAKASKNFIGSAIAAQL